MACPSPPPLHVALDGQRLGEVGRPLWAGTEGEAESRQHRNARLRTPNRRELSALVHFDTRRNVRLVDYLRSPPRLASSALPPTVCLPKRSQTGGETPFAPPLSISCGGLPQTGRQRTRDRPVTTRTSRGNTLQRTPNRRGLSARTHLAPGRNVRLSDYLRFLSPPPSNDAVGRRLGEVGCDEGAGRWGKRRAR